MKIRRALGTTAAAVALSAVAVVAVACGGGETESAPPEPVAEPVAVASAPRSGARGAAVDLSGPEYQGDHSLPGDATAGEATYQRLCLACHAADGSGNGGMTGGDFVHDRRRLAKNNDTLLRAIREGVSASPAMPPWGATLSDQEMRDVLSYIRQRFTPAEPATP